MNPQRAERIRRGMEAFSTGHLPREVAEETLAEDAVWHFAGSHPLAGDHHGRDAIHSFLNALIEKTHGTAKVEPVDLLDGNRFTMSFTRFTADGPDGTPVEVLFADAWEWDDEDRIKEYWSLANNQAAIDAVLS